MARPTQPHDVRRLGSAAPQRPVSTLTAHLRLETWSGADFAPVPDGTRVQLCDEDPLIDDILAEGSTSGGRVSLTGADPDDRHPDVYFTAALPDGRTWDSRGRAALDGAPGLLPDTPDRVLGTPAVPRVFRLEWFAFLRLVAFVDGATRPLPGGVPVALVEADPFGVERVLATARTHPDGRAVLVAAELYEDAPDLFVRVGPGGPLRDAWDSRAAFADDDADQPGFLLDHAGPGLGSAQDPVVFDVMPERRRVHGGCSARPLIDGVALLAALEDAIAQAQLHIHLEMMLFFDDPMGRRVAEALMARARAGVTVRLLVDWTTTRDIHQLVTAEKAWVRLFRTLPDDEADRLVAWYDAHAPAERARGQVDDLIATLESTPNLTLLDSSFPKLQLDPRLPPGLPAAYRDLEQALPLVTLARVDHRKMLVVDGVRALLGGQNIGAEYLYSDPVPDGPPPDDQRAWAGWHDAFIDLQGPVVADCQRLFRERWVAEGGDAFALDGGEFPDLPVFDDGLPVGILRTTPGADHEIERVLLGLFRGARRRIDVANPYFSSPDALEALCAAARRGVTVRFVLPDHRNDSVDFHYAGRMAYGRMIAAGIEVFEYPHRMTHTKAFAVDDCAIIGSANLNRTSFQRHYEVCALVNDAAFTRALRDALFDPDTAKSRRIRAEDVEALLDINLAAKAWLSGVVWTQL